MFVAIYWVLARAAARSTSWSRLIEGEPGTPASDGNVSEARLRAHAISQTDFAEALRLNGLADVSGARLVTLEPSGKISILKRTA